MRLAYSQSHLSPLLYKPPRFRPTLFLTCPAASCHFCYQQSCQTPATTRGLCIVYDGRYYVWCTHSWSDVQHHMCVPVRLSLLLVAVIWTYSSPSFRVLGFLSAVERIPSSCVRYLSLGLNSVLPLKSSSMAYYVVMTDPTDIPSYWQRRHGQECMWSVPPTLICLIIQPVHPFYLCFITCSRPGKHINLQKQFLLVFRSPFPQWLSIHPLIHRLPLGCMFNLAIPPFLCSMSHTDGRLSNLHTMCCVLSLQPFCRPYITLFPTSQPHRSSHPVTSLSPSAHPPYLILVLTLPSPSFLPSPHVFNPPSPPLPSPSLARPFHTAIDHMQYSGLQVRGLCSA